MKSLFGTFSGVKTHYEVWGAGDTPIVFLHGWGGSTESFYSLAERLESKGDYTLYLLDVPGFGESDMPPIQGWGSSEYARWLKDFLQERKLNNPVLIGHSNGGRIILRYTLMEDHTSSMVLMGSAGVKWPPTWKMKVARIIHFFFGWMKYILPTRFYNVIRRKVFKAHDWADVDPNLKPSLQKILAETDMRPLLEAKRIKNKTLLLWGGHDTYTPLKSGKELDRLLLDSRLVVYDDGRHALHRTHTDKVADEIYTFLT